MKPPIQLHIIIDEKALNIFHISFNMQLYEKQLNIYKIQPEPRQLCCIHQVYGSYMHSHMTERYRIGCK